MIGFTAQRLMELEVEGLTGAAHGERNPVERISLETIAPLSDDPIVKLPAVAA